MLKSMRSQRLGHNLVTEQQQIHRERDQTCGDQKRRLEGRGAGGDGQKLQASSCKINQGT